MTSVNLSGKEKLAVLGFLLGAIAVIWVLMIKPNNYNWVDGGQTTATVETILANKKVVGPTYIKALVKLESGQQTVVNLPANPNIKTGSELRLSVKQDAEQSQVKSYSFVGVVKPSNP